jgi:hypothetical protein
MKYEKKILNGLFGIMLLVLLMPLVQQKSNYFSITPLKGAVVVAEGKPLTLEHWFDASFQTAMEQRLNDVFGFRPWMVRIKNQMDYSLFRQAHAQGVIIGKDGYLYESKYIYSYLGMDFWGEDSIRIRMNRLKRIQTELEKQGKTVLLVFAPGKGSYYPEFIPDSFPSQKHPTHYESYLKYAQQLKINHIDFNHYFLQLKKKTKYILYPKYGIHWSHYAMCLAGDSIIRKIESLRKEQYNHFFWKSVKISKKPQDTDRDIEEGMNLMFSLPEYDLAYPELQFEQDSTKKKPDVLVISDSFYWGLYNLGITKLFDNNDFWYYNRENYSTNPNKKGDVSTISLKESFQNHQVIVIMATEGTIENLGWGMIEKADSLISHRTN